MILCPQYMQNMVAKSSNDTYLDALSKLIHFNLLFNQSDDGILDVSNVEVDKHNLAT